MSDLISRAEVHKTLSLLATEGGTDAKMLLSDAHEFIDALPSAEQVTGKLKNPCDSLLTEDSDERKEQKSKLDLISRADAIETVQTYLDILINSRRHGDDFTFINVLTDIRNKISALPSADAVSREEYDQLEALYDAIRIYAPSAEAPTGELILRADAIELLTEIVFDEPPYFDSETLCRLYAEEQINTLPSAEIAETEPIVIRSKTLLPTKDFKEWAKRIREVNSNAVVIPCDAEVASAEAVQGEWIPCSERLPEDLEAVNVTWVNHNPPVYYQYTKDVPNADTAVYYRGVWYWWDSTICDVLGEYGEKCGAEQIDKDIEILAWMPLPTPYKGGEDK